MRALLRRHAARVTVLAVASLAVGGPVRAEEGVTPPAALPPLSEAPSSAPSSGSTTGSTSGSTTGTEPDAPSDTPSSAAANQGGASLEPPSPSEYDPAADMDPEAITAFRDTLAPYGAWEDDVTYGTVWFPSTAVVGVDFAPYVTHGHWGYGVDNSWLWMSDFSWGWAPFHYGRWVWVPLRGWAWIPGRVYSPAWVVWRTGFYDDYYVGWAPMPPTWYWRRGFAVRLGYVPRAPYVFCSATYVFSPHLRMHIAPPHRVGLIAPRTRPYVAATAGVVGQNPSAAAMTRGPSIAEARIPASSVPAQRVSHDARALSFARPNTGADVGSRGAPQFSRSPGAAQFARPASPSAPSVHRPVTPGAPGPLPATRPTPLAPTPAPFSPSPYTYSRPAPLPPMPRPASPAPFSGSYARPSAPPPVYSRPAAPPSFSRPSAPPPSFSRPSAPPPSFSRPAAPSGGGFSRPSAPARPASPGGGFSRPSR